MIFSIVCLGQKHDCSAVVTTGTCMEQVLDSLNNMDGAQTVFNACCFLCLCVCEPTSFLRTRACLACIVLPADDQLDYHGCDLTH